MGQGSKWASVIYPLKRVNSKEETKGGIKMGQLRSKWDCVICYSPTERVKMGFCCLSSGRVKLLINSKKETKSKVKMGLSYYPLKESKWAAVVYPLTESN